MIQLCCTIKKENRILEIYQNSLDKKYYIYKNGKIRWIEGYNFIKDAEIKANFLIDQERFQPDPKLHKITSFIKSGVRIVGYCFLPYDIPVAAGLLVVSEVVGVIEEMV